MVSSEICDTDQEALQVIERRLGRRVGERWVRQVEGVLGPGVLDVDDGDTGRLQRSAQPSGGFEWHHQGRVASLEPADHGVDGAGAQCLDPVQQPAEALVAAADDDPALAGDVDDQPEESSGSCHVGLGGGPLSSSCHHSSSVRRPSASSRQNW